MISPYARTQARAIEEEQVLRALVHHGPLSFGRINRKVLSALTLRQCDLVVTRLARADQIVTSERGPKVWSITDAGRARLGQPPFNARVRSTTPPSTNTPESNTP